MITSRRSAALRRVRLVNLTIPRYDGGHDRGPGTQAALHVRRGAPTRTAARCSTSTPGSIRAAASPRTCIPAWRSASTSSPGGRASWPGSAWRTAAPGDVVVVPAGTRHAYRNDGDEPAHVRCDVRPPSSLQAFLEEVAALSQQRRDDAPRAPAVTPRAFAQMAALAERHRAMVTLLFPPAPPPVVQRLLFPRWRASPADGSRSAPPRALQGHGPRTERPRRRRHRRLARHRPRRHPHPARGGHARRGDVAPPQPGARRARRASSSTSRPT